MQLNRLRLKVSTRGIENQEGSALIFFITIIFLASVLAGFLVDLKEVSEFGELSYNHHNRAYFMAEAGGNYALGLVKEDIEADGSYDDDHGLNNMTFTLDDASGQQDGQFTIAVDDSNESHTLVDSIGTINAGISSGVRVKLTYVLDKGTEPFELSHSLFAVSTLYLSQNVSVNGDVATNTSSIIKDQDASVSGEEETGYEGIPSPLTFSCGDCTAEGSISGADTLAAGTYEYLNFTMGTGSVITVNGDVELYVAHDFTAGQQATIRFLPDSSLTVYVNGNVLFNREFNVEFSPSPERPEDFVIYGTTNAGSIHIDEDAVFQGVVYAPGADIQVDQGANVTGALVGDNVSIDKDGTFTYDAGVSGISTPGGNIVLGQPRRYFSP